MNILSETEADEQVAEVLETKALVADSVTDDIEKAAIMQRELEESNNGGGARRQLSIVRHEIEHTERISAIEAEIREALPFKGSYGTRVDDGRLMIPEAYLSLLEFGGVVTYSTAGHLLLFGRLHWQRMEQLITRELGLHADRDRITRHFYRGKMDFNQVNDDGSITLTKALMKYADLKDKAVLVGVVYFAEIHSPDNWKDDKLDPRDVSRLSNALA